MRARIEGYESFPGDHCGSVAMRGLLHHYCGLELPEPVVFGLGAGATSLYLRGPGLDPAAMFFGRTGSMEQDVAVHLQIDYREQPEPDDERAWQRVRDEVAAGRPTMLSGDIFYLDYREFKVHFPAHRFVLLGFDDDTEQVWIADRIRPEAEVCSYRALFLSRNPPEGLSTKNLWGRFHDVEVGRDLVGATRKAIATCAGAMLAGGDAVGAGAGLAAEGELRSVQGVNAARIFADDLPGFAAREDASWLAQFNASAIEKFGNGGGNFRRLYAGFLAWARDLDPSRVPEGAPELAVSAADAWTAAATALFRASDDVTDVGAWNEASHHVRRAADLEERLFHDLAQSA